MLEQSITDAVKVKLERQAADGPSNLSIDTINGFRVNGSIDLVAHAMAAAGSVADGP
jgi:hypothetical protein